MPGLQLYRFWVIKGKPTGGGKIILQKSSITDVWLGSKYASVNITLHLTFFRRT